MHIQLPDPSMVILIGASGSGKSTFAQQHFKPTEILSSDVCRGLISDDDNNQEVSKEAFELLHFIAEQRMAGGKMVVVDATNVWPVDRLKYVKIAQKYRYVLVAIVFYMPMELCEERNLQRPNRTLGPPIIYSHTTAVRTTLEGLRDEGFRDVYVLNSPDEVEAVEIERAPLGEDLPQVWPHWGVVEDRPLPLEHPAAREGTQNGPGFLTAFGARLRALLGMGPQA